LDSSSSNPDSSSAPSAPSTPPAAAAGGEATLPDAAAPPPAAESTAPPAVAPPTPEPAAGSPPAASAEAAAESKPPAEAASQPAGADANPPSAQAETPTAAKPRERKPTPAKPVDPVSEAERYVYGRGARQDCDRGMSLLKSSAGQSNPKAMISLGALYSTGTCTPRDLPTAYRWFALALHKQPDDQALQDDLQNLWSQMTPPERQLAIKLSQ
jgi:TPR repeat protein